MKILIQWTTNTPTDWEETDSSNWSILPKKPEPVGGEIVNGTKGWCHGLNVQGVIFLADHYHVRGITDGVRVTTWNDDLTFSPPGMRYARMRDFLFCAQDSVLGGAINTRQSQVIFAERGIMPRFTEPLQNTIVRDWALFRPPTLDVMHGFGVTDRLHGDHLQARTIHSWREWIEGLDPFELDSNGRIKQQRAQGRFSRATGTRTYIQRDTILATGTHIADNELAFELTTDTAAEVSQATSSDSQNRSFIWTTPTDEPDSDDWPTGLYRCQFDTVSIGSDMSFGLRDVGGGGGHFGRTRADLTLDRQIGAEMSQAAFTATGLNLASRSFNWLAGFWDDRFECVVAQENVAPHGGDQTLTLEVNTTDSFADGPWPAPEPPGGPRRVMII